MSASQKGLCTVDNGQAKTIRAQPYLDSFMCLL